MGGVSGNMFTNILLGQRGTGSGVSSLKNLGGRGSLSLLWLSLSHRQGERPRAEGLVLQYRQGERQRAEGSLVWCAMDRGLTVCSFGIREGSPDGLEIRGKGENMQWI